MRGFPKKGVPLNHPFISISNGIFHYKPSSYWGTPFYGHPYDCWVYNAKYMLDSIHFAWTYPLVESAELWSLIVMIMGVFLMYNQLGSTRSRSIIFPFITYSWCISCPISDFGGSWFWTWTTTTLSNCPQPSGGSWASVWDHYLVAHRVLPSGKLSHTLW